MSMFPLKPCFGNIGTPVCVMNQTGHSLKRKITKNVECNYLIFLPLDYSSRREPWPLILCLHGIGECGDDLELVKKHGVAKIVENRPDFPFIVLSPQCPAEGWWSAEVLGTLLDEVEKKYRVDKTRIYVTGLSMGGFGTWDLALAYPHRFAAIAPICGGSKPVLAHRIKHLPTWAFHGAKDKTVPLSSSQDMIRSIRRSGGKPKLTIYPNEAHDSWTQTYENPRLYKWFLSHTSKPLLNGPAHPPK